LVENSSKLLKRELDEKKAQVEEGIKSKMKQLYEARTEYHNFFEERNRVKLEERMLNEELAKEDSFRISHKSIPNIRPDKSNELRLQKRGLL
jgi:regulator of replication initiation timing